MGLISKKLACLDSIGWPASKNYAHRESPLLEKLPANPGQHPFELLSVSFRSSHTDLVPTIKNQDVGADLCAAKLNILVKNGVVEEQALTEDQLVSFRGPVRCGNVNCLRKRLFHTGRLAGVQVFQFDSDRTKSLLCELPSQTKGQRRFSGPCDPLQNDCVFEDFVSDQTQDRLDELVTPSVFFQERIDALTALIRSFCLVPLSLDLFPAQDPAVRVHVDLA